MRSRRDRRALTGTRIWDGNVTVSFVDPADESGKRDRIEDVQRKESNEIEIVEEFAHGRVEGLESRWKVGRILKVLHEKLQVEQIGEELELEREFAIHLEKIDLGQYVHMR